MEKFKFINKNKVSQLPKSVGVYVFKREGEILYIGKAANIRERVKNHFQQPGYRDYLFLDKVKKIGYIKTDSEIEALLLEANLIKRHQPKYNIVWKDDKNYFFVGITKEDFPKIFWTHQRNLKSQISNLKSDFIGPFVNGKSLKETLRVLRKVFPYRSCNKIPKHPCLWYQLKRCPAPCLLKSPLAHQIKGFTKSTIEECQRNAENFMEVLQGKKIQVLRDLKREMKKTAISQDFERAARIRDQIRSLEKVLAHAKIFEPQEITFQKNWDFTQKILQKILKTKEGLSRIEAYDVSNIQGQKATGSMVTFINGLPDKNFYRKFKIRIAGRPNDTAMIKEILRRRLKHPEWRLPDAVLIDGGKAQFNTAKSVVKNKIKVMAIAKKKNELFIEKQKKPILLKSLPREIFNLILQLRDEAHRFARKYHLKLREIDLHLKS